MKLQQLTDKLVRAARLNPPAEMVPSAFEQRIMARIRGAVSLDPWTVWGNALWRAAIACLLLTLLSGAWSVWSGSARESQLEFSQEFERAMMVMAQPQLEEAW